MKNLVFSFGVDLHLPLGIVNFKIESSNQEISLQRKGGRIYDSALHTVRIIDQNRLRLVEVVGQGKSLNKVGITGVADTCIGVANYPDTHKPIFFFRIRGTS